MRKVACLVAMALWAIMSTPYAHADEVVDVSVTGFTIEGAKVCGITGINTCIIDFSASFQWDNTTEQLVTPSVTSSSSGDLGTFSFASVTVYPSDYGFNFGDSTGDFLIIAIPFASDGTIQPGTYTNDGFYPTNVELFCAFISPFNPLCQVELFGAQNVEVSTPIYVTSEGGGGSGAVPEPSSVALLAAGLMGLVAFAKFKA